MALTVKDRALHVATFRFVEVRLMELLAAWIPSTPEMEVKLLFGPHVWECAEAADALGRRAHELRLPLQHSIAPAPRYVRLLDDLAAVTGAAPRICALYDAVLPGLAARYRAYLDRTDPLMDAPTVRVMERILQARDRMVREAHALRAQMPALASTDSGLAARWADAQATAALLADPADAAASRQAA